MKATLIKASGEERDIEPESGQTFTLAELQAYVGGYIEVHRLPDGNLICMNEDGMRLNLPTNAAATVAAYNLNTASGGILGDVVICEPEMLQ